jgi:hypothetical protein
MIKSKPDLLKVVKHYKDAGEYDTAIRFIRNFPMKNVNAAEEIKKIENLKKGIKKEKPIVADATVEEENPSEKEDEDK